jgi:anti-sigma factor RsiW
MTTSGHPTEERLNDHVDGLLSAAEAAATEAHLAGCAACRAEVEGLRALLGEVRALPRDLAPPAELWEALRAETSARPSRAARTVRLTRRELAAAAVLLVALSSGITAALLRGRGGPAPAGPVAVAGAVARPPAAWVEFRQAEAEYVRTADDLEAVLATSRDALAPETVEVVEENLRIIDAAIRDAREALARDPANAELSNVLAATYRDKIDVLERTLRLSAQT